MGNNYYRDTIPSMLRRCKGWDYKGRGIYMLTLVVRDRQPLLGSLAGDTENAYIDLSDLGKAVNTEVEGIPSHFPQIRVLGKQVMPDHLHMLLFVQEPIPVHLGTVVNGFKLGTNRAYWTAFSERTRTEHPDSATITVHQRVSCADAFGASEKPAPVSCARSFGEREKLPGFWDDGYHDRILLHDGQLDAMIRYIADNPRRLAPTAPSPSPVNASNKVLLAGLIPRAHISCLLFGAISPNKNSKKWHTNLRMSFFYCNFAPQNETAATDSVKKRNLSAIYDRS